MTRKEILETAESIVNGEREEHYGTPENNFRTIGKLWEAYLGAQYMGRIEFEPHDVAAMLALLKIARIAGGQAKDDNWVDLAGYAACGGELQCLTEAGTKTKETLFETKEEVEQCIRDLMTKMTKV